MSPDILWSAFVRSLALAGNRTIIIVETIDNLLLCKVANSRLCVHEDLWLARLTLEALVRQRVEIIYACAKDEGGFASDCT
jgi:hypothetical protein